MNIRSPESAWALDVLRHRIAALDRGRGRREDSPLFFATGHAGLDAALGGGLARGRLHELFADAQDAASLGGFAVALAARACAGKAGSPDGDLLWLRTGATERLAGNIHAPGLVELGLDPNRLILGRMTDDVMLLRCAADAARCAGLGAVLIEMQGNPRALDLTASRRLALAAEASGVPLLLLRLEGRVDPSAADTRWHVVSAPSAPLDRDVPEAIGRPTFDLRLLRRRTGPDGLCWRLEWNRDRCSFGEAPLSGAVLPLPADGPAAHSAA